jgi:lipid II:glycine glycyltransferase (peptidoglycan interpeptide bridge formation enzyme)
MDGTVEELKAENLELKLSSIRKELEVFKVDMHRHLDLILEQTSKTNGSVAKAMEKISELERQENKQKIEELKIELKAHQKKTKFWTLLSTNKWIAGLIFAVMYAFTIPEFRSALVSIFKIVG